MSCLWCSLFKHRSYLIHSWWNHWFLFIFLTILLFLPFLIWNLSPLHHDRLWWVSFAVETFAVSCEGCTSVILPMKILTVGTNYLKSPLVTSEGKHFQTDNSITYCSLVALSLVLMHSMRTTTRHVFLPVFFDSYFLKPLDSVIIRLCICVIREVSD